MAFNHLVGRLTENPQAVSSGEHNLLTIGSPHRKSLTLSFIEHSLHTRQVTSSNLVTGTMILGENPTLSAEQ
jgi:hypothetical protein